MLLAQNIKKTYGPIQVLKGINLQIATREVVSIVGSSGAGKSTLLHILGTLDKADQGSLILNDIDLLKLKDRELAKVRNLQMGFIFQFHNLLPEFTVEENVCIPAFIAGTKEAEAKLRCSKLLKLLNIDHRAKHKPSELSGGEQQRTAVARALINNPEIVFADEPSGNLDSKNAEDLHQLFFKLRDELNQSFVIVTHNQDLANMADRKLEMKDGVILS